MSISQSLLNKLPIILSASYLPCHLIIHQTGYLGGTVLTHLLTLHPNWESSIPCLVRSPSDPNSTQLSPPRANSLVIAHPGLTIVTGTLEDRQAIEDEAMKADIVLHFASSDHVGAAEAIKRGLERGALERGKKGEGGACWIHTSGTDLLLDPKLLAA